MLSSPTEKWLKALMAQRGLRQVRIHDLDRLAALLEEDGVRLPIGRDRLDELTQYAVPLRYDELLDAEPVDREATVALVNELGEWAEAQLSKAPAETANGEEEEEAQGEES